MSDSDHSDVDERGIDPETVLDDQQQETTPASDATQESGYGLPTPRDEETGQLLPDDHEYEWNGRTVEIKLIPPTLEQLKEYQKFGDDVDMDELEAVVDRHIIRPDIPAAGMTSREVNCYIAGIIDYGNDGGDAQMQRAREAIEEREGRDGGN